MASLGKELTALLEKELRVEWRQKYALSGILLYVISTVFVCYLSFKRVVDVPTWNALYWIIILFTAVNAIAKSFMAESKSRQLYFYTLTSPQAVILSKIIYNTVLMCVLAIVCLFFYQLLTDSMVQDMGMFTVVVLLGSIGLSATLTLVSAISAQGNNSGTLMAILSFPIILPLLLTLIKASQHAIDGIPWSVNGKYLLILGALNVVVISLSYILFPYLWRD